MGKRRFSKPALTVFEQIERLRSRQMTITDVDAAAHLLRHISYYRLAAYWLPFEADHATHTFRTGTSLIEVIQLYEFDRELRLLVLDAIERVEVSFRAVWAHRLAIEYGPHAHMDPSIVKDEVRWRTFLSSILKDIGRSNEIFIRHMLKNYIELVPPIWATSEVLPLGALSKWYENLRSKRVKSRISCEYGLDEGMLESWLRHITYIRNLCAHHGRLWNREFTITPMIPKTKPLLIVGAMNSQSRGLYNSLVILLHMMSVIENNHNWRAELIRLIESAPFDPLSMGFPKNWDSLPIWS